MADALGVEQLEQQQPTAKDYLGVESPIAFSGQPALPVAGPAGAGAAPPTIGGGGVALPADDGGAAGGLTPESPFGDLASAFDGSGDGGPGAGEGVGVGQGSFESATGQAGPFGVGVSPFGASLQAGPLNLRASPAGVGVGVNITGNKTVDSVINQAIGLLGIPTSLTPSMISTLAGVSGLAGLVSSMISGVGLAMAPAAFAHSIAQSMSTSTVNMQEALATQAANLGLALTPAQEASIAKFGLPIGPTQGGPQAIGTLAPGIFDNPVAGIGLGQGPPGTPTGPPAAMFSSFADLAAALGFGRAGQPDVPDPSVASSPPSFSDPTGLGDPGGPDGGPGPGAGGSGAAGEASGDAPGF